MGAPRSEPLLHSLSWGSAGRCNTHCVWRQRASPEPGSCLAISPCVGQGDSLLLGEENHPHPFSLQKMPLFPAPVPKRARKAGQGGSTAAGVPGWGHQRPDAQALPRRGFPPGLPKDRPTVQLFYCPIAALPRPLDSVNVEGRWPATGRSKAGPGPRWSN